MTSIPSKARPSTALENRLKSLLDNWSELNVDSTLESLNEIKRLANKANIAWLVNACDAICEKYLDPNTKDSRFTSGPAYALLQDTYAFYYDTYHSRKETNLNGPSNPHPQA